MPLENHSHFIICQIPSSSINTLILSFFQTLTLTLSSPYNTQILPILLSSKTNSREKMVKFSKQYEAQLVPEWKDAFVDYGQLKKDLKKIQLLNSNKNSSKQQKSSSFASSFISSLGKINLFSQKRCDHGTIQVHPPVFSLFLTMFPLII